MANMTLSGIFSIGSPMSRVRIKGEAINAITEESFELLHLTDEGKEILQKFSGSIGCDYSQMDDHYKADMVQTRSKELFCFLCGISYLSEKR